MGFGPMRNVVWLVFAKFGTVALILFLIWQAYEYFGPRKPQVPEDRQEVATALFPEIVDDLSANRGTILSLAMLHLGNDPSDFVTNGLYNELELAGIFDLRDHTLGEKLYEVMRFRHDEYAGSADAIAEGRSRDVEGVVFGEVESFETDSGGAQISLLIGLADVNSGQVIFSQRYTDSDGEGLAALQKPIKKFSWIKRFLAWAIFVLLLPVFTITYLRAAVRKRSNRANGFTLGLYTFVGVALAYMLLGVGFSGFWSALGLLIAIVVVLLYNVFLMSYALRLEED